MKNRSKTDQAPVTRVININPEGASIWQDQDGNILVEEDSRQIGVAAELRQIQMDDLVKIFNDEPDTATRIKIFLDRNSEPSVSVEPPEDISYMNPS